MFDGKKVLITGGTGSLGIALTKKILQTEVDTIRIYSRNESKQIEMQSQVNDSRLRFLIGDVRDKERLSKALEDIDIVIHAAAETFIPESFKNPYRFYQFNINASLNIAEYCRIKKVKKLIYFNTYPYGKPKYNPVDEKYETSPHSPYTESKLISEKLLFSYLDKDISATSLRIFNPHGYSQKDDFLIPTIVRQALTNDLIKVRDARPKRDYLYIEDLIVLLIKIIH